MYRNFLQRINFFIFFLIAVCAAVLQSTVFSYFPLHYFQPDILLVICVYMGYRRDPIEGGIFAVLCSFIAQSNSSAGESYLLAAYILVFVIAKIMSRAVVVPDILTSVGIVAGLTLFKKLLLLILLSTTASAGMIWSNVETFLIYLIPGLAVQAAVTPLAFSWFTRIDLRTYKDAHSDDEYHFINRDLN